VASRDPLGEAALGRPDAATRVPPPRPEGFATSPPPAVNKLDHDEVDDIQRGWAQNWPTVEEYQRYLAAGGKPQIVPGAILYASVDGWQINHYCRVVYRSRSAIKVLRMEAVWTHSDGVDRYFLPLDGSESLVEERKRIAADGRISNGENGSMVIWDGQAYCYNWSD